MGALENLKVKIFADGAELVRIEELAQNPLIKGFTTNPTLMRKANVPDYQAFAKDVLRIIPDRPVSLEVFSDEFEEMEHQAREIASWGENVYVKIPVTNTRGEFSGPLIKRLALAGVQVNVTALMTSDQVASVADCLVDGTRSFVSLFAGRVADTGRDPAPIMVEALRALRPRAGSELIWASSRELLNIFQANAIGCHIITVANDLLAKLALVERDLEKLSLDTVRMFRRDAVDAGFTINVSEPVTARA